MHTCCKNALIAQIIMQQTVTNYADIMGQLPEIKCMMMMMMRLVIHNQHLPSFVVLPII